MKINIGKKVEGLSKVVERRYVNKGNNNFYFFQRNVSVEKAVDNVENLWLSTGISRFSPGDRQTFPHFLTENDTFPVAGYACYGNEFFRILLNYFC